MCGINGIFRLEESAPPIARAEVLAVREALRSRGPDGSGLWLSADGACGLGHRRLAIIDLSDAGSQPMVSRDRRYRIVYNGEIYNFRELRLELSRSGFEFSSNSDTEVILALYEREGPAMLTRLRGMFAFAIWDDLENRLFLARDPYGIKPLYYSDEGDYFRFASQVSALRSVGSLGGEVDPCGLVGFLLWGSVPEPTTLWRGIRALPAGHYAVVDGKERMQPRSFYRIGRSPDESMAEMDLLSAITDSVRAHLVSDVPIAVFLSAGLDSALVAGLVASLAAAPATTITLTFDEFVGTSADEGPLARRVADRLGTRHLEKRMGKDQFIALFEDAVRAMDQPSIDGFNTFLISACAREAGFKVALSGLGGDELLGGYDSFRKIPRWRWAAKTLSRIPGALAGWPSLASTLRPGQPKLTGLLEHGSTLAGAYLLRRGLFLPSELPSLLGARLAQEGLAELDAMSHLSAALEDARRDPWTAVHVLESTQYMRNQLLRDADWASMAHSLEIRVPLVDFVLRERAAAVDFEPARSLGKAEVLRQTGLPFPPKLLGRRKTGFSVPVSTWLGGRETASSPGQSSRQLALELLPRFGIDLRKSAGRLDAA